MAIPQIIVVDDSLEDIALLRSALAAAGSYEVREIRDGEAALRFVTELAAGEKCKDPCLFVLDLHLPKVAGMEILKHLRSYPDLSHVPAVVLTSFASPSHQAEALSVGASCLEKPSTLDEFEQLARHIADLCNATPRAVAR